jgi:fructose-1,6-bisphosphatase
VYKTTEASCRHGGWIGLTGKTNVHGEAVKKLDELGNLAFVEASD